ncbi:DUF6538 domain-containing protein [Paracoccus thiocyanatus]|uniref:DUF6538 domain-containing protein n=1 Tax=Paracoccus thiocyanatus TaxID=34006 RepID=UPI0037445BBC
MVATPHILQRGHSYHWRRRLPLLSTKIGVLQVSLRTTDPTHAGITARRLTAVSEVQRYSKAADRKRILFGDQEQKLETDPPQNGNRASRA